MHLDFFCGFFLFSMLFLSPFVDVDFVFRFFLFGFFLLQCFRVHTYKCTIILFFRNDDTLALRIAFTTGSWWSPFVVCRLEGQSLERRLSLNDMRVATFCRFCTITHLILFVLNNVLAMRRWSKRDSR